MMIEIAIVPLMARVPIFALVYYPFTTGVRVRSNARIFFINRFSAGSKPVALHAGICSAFDSSRGSKTLASSTTSDSAEINDAAAVGDCSATGADGIGGTSMSLSVGVSD